MKILLLVPIALLLAIFYEIKMSSSVYNIETYEYELLGNIENVELRRYGQALFSEVKLPSNSYSSSSSLGFRILAGYIFGSNSKNQEIAMTSPVIMEIDTNVIMKFMVPSKYKLSELPTPKNPKIRFQQEKGGIYAAIQFGGWASDEKIKAYADDLKSILNKNQISFSNKVIYMGYNPPYQITNRRNEILLKIDPNYLE